MSTGPNTEPDDSVLDEISKIQMSDRVRGLREAYFRAVPEVCTERAVLVTRGSEKHFEKQPPTGAYQPTVTSLKKAELYAKVLGSRNKVIWHREARELVKGKDEDGKDKNLMVPFPIAERSLFAGSTTSRFKGVPLYPEFIATWIWPELDLIQQREKNPYYLFGSTGNPISESQRKELLAKDSRKSQAKNTLAAKTEDELEQNDITLLNQEVFPYWIDKNITELGRVEAQPKLDGTSYALEFELLQNLVFYITTKPNCISHTIPRFDVAISKGLNEIVRQADVAQGKEGVTDEQKSFYKAVVTSMRGIISFSRSLADEARRFAATANDASEKKELEELAEIHSRVPAEPATTFRDGLTTIWMCWIALHLENPNAAMSLGRLDQLLRDLYLRGLTGNADQDKACRERAVELLCCFWLKIGDHVPMVPSTGEKLFGGTGSNQAITIGGVTAEKGEDAVNELTYVILRAIELMRLRDPNLNARYHPQVHKNDKRYLRRLCEVNLSTGATPALHNDSAVILALTARGETREQARDYGIVGCVEPISSGRTYGHTGAILLNLVAALELTLFRGRHRLRGLDEKEPLDGIAADVASCTTFAEFQELFLKHAAWLVDRTVRLNNLFGRIHQSFYPTPILSSLFEGPMDKGIDLIAGGAMLNSSGVAIIGLADVVDSLAAIEKWIFTDREWAGKDASIGPVPIADAFALLRAAMERDFGADRQRYEQGPRAACGDARELDLAALKRDERLYAMLRTPDKTPKFGNGDDKADAIAKWLTQNLDRLYKESVDETCRDEHGKPRPGTNYRGGGYRVGYWSMTNHAGFGRLSYSTPNGRRKGESFASGITPVSGMSDALPLALASVAKLPAAAVPNGMAFNIKLSPAAGAAYRKKMLDEVTVHVDKYFGDGSNDEASGGMEIQFNITSRQDFIEAQKHPEAYPTLLVRVSGYTAYFKDLNPQMQEEIIERTEYSMLPEHVVNIAARPRDE